MERDIGVDIEKGEGEWSKGSKMLTTYEHTWTYENLGEEYTAGFFVPLYYLEQF